MLRKALITALADRNIQGDAHQNFTDALPPPLVKEWTVSCKAWEAAPYPKYKSKAVNPYATDEKCESSLSGFF